MSSRSTSTPAPAFGLTMLPTELLERILSDVFPYHVYRPGRNKYALLAVMKTCRLLYALGRARLYYRPLDSCEEGSFGILAATLQSNGALALAVTDLIGLVTRIDDYRGLYSCGSYREQKQARNDALDFQLDILRACPNISAVSVMLTPGPETTIIASLLAQYTRLRRLTLAFDFPPDSAEADKEGCDLEAFRACLEQLAESPATLSRQPRLDCLGLRPVEHGGRRRCDFGPILRNVAADLEIDISIDQGVTALRCCLAGLFKADTVPVASAQWPAKLAILDSSGPDTDSVVEAYIELPSLLQGNRLTSMTVYKSGASELLHLSKYGDPKWPEMPSVPPSDHLFALFPQVRYLCLSELHQMSHGQLVTLAEASPFLVTLKLVEARWDLRPDDLTLVPPQELSSFERRVAETLETLADLTWVDLGIWPYADSRDDPGRAGLRDRLAQRGTRLIVSGCYL